MICSSACAYAIRAMTRLAMVRPDGYVLLGELCEGTDLPRHFVAKIFQDLVRRGLLVSAKGRGGGFALARKPDRLSLHDIVAAVDGTDDLERCVLGLSRCNAEQACALHDEWKPIHDQLTAFLRQTTLTDMARSTRAKLEALGEKLVQPKSRSKPVRLPGK